MFQVHMHNQDVYCYEELILILLKTWCGANLTGHLYFLIIQFLKLYRNSQVLIAHPKKLFIVTYTP